MPQVHARARISVIALINQKSQIDRMQLFLRDVSTVSTCHESRQVCASLPSRANGVRIQRAVV